MRTLAGLITWVEPHVAHFLAVALATFAGAQVILGGQSYDVTTQHGALALVVALAASIWRAYEASSHAPAAGAAGTPPAVR